ncbi:MAG: ABC-type glycerol-3-phosphate transport system substrate-binding protein [Amycolatopsis sp.]|jgi:ABC-type glycerol-3-phosphate transport system substrate-binding protein|uniref:ABC transporter substrate-binding protein n=1 Tax=Amycolatopsis sp. TaxID=37632 RepID=UPI002630C7A3|nr:extracellular solute-binding protein [Amycolatopsis sp.]MCU1686401.1 ABC-type glycerol-3-phosphate transport system substrate-binding protein [Amycolatopsis sp.]
MDVSLNRRRFLGLGLTAAVAVGVTACSSSTSSGVDADGVVTISVNGLPPATQTVDRKNFEDDIRAFEAGHPKIKIDAREGLMDPQTFSAKLAGGQLEDVFYVYFTDPASLIQRHQAADISQYLKDVPYVGDIRKPLQDVFRGPDGKVYGLPTGNYSLGLVYNRALFTKAGLDPDKPPTTWAEVRDAAKRISALGNGIVGYADYSKNGQGGWHLTSWIYSMGGDVATRQGSTWKAAFTGNAGRQALQVLHDMRFTDQSMGTRQLLEIADVQQLMGAGTLGMYMAGPDNIPTIVKQYERKYDDYGLAALPGSATLGGGDGFMFNTKNSPAKIKAGLTWVQWKYLDPDREEAITKKSAGGDIPIGLPQPNLWQGIAQAKVDAVHKQYSNVPQKNYQPFVDRSGAVTVKVEPPNAQQIYTVLDGVMQAVLTKPDADFGQLLSDAEKKVNTVLETVK